MEDTAAAAAGGEAERTTSSEADLVVRWPVRYRAYRKARAIQLKPAHDKDKHFSLVWTRTRGDVSAEAFNEMDAAFRALLAAKGNVLRFRIIKPTTNCTYGRLDAELEALVKSFRARFKLCAEKDLPWEHPEHLHLRAQEPDWSPDNPIMFHVHSRDASDPAWFKSLREAPQDTVLTLSVEVLPTSA